MSRSLLSIFPAKGRQTLKRVERIAFTVSVAALAFLYGYISMGRQLPPYDFLHRVVRQAQNLVSSPYWTEPKVYQGEGVTRQIELEKPILLSSFWPNDGEWKSGVRLISSNGATLHRWPLPHDRLFPEPNENSRPFFAVANTDRIDVAQVDIHGTHITPEGDLLFNVGYEGIVRIGRCGNIQWQLQNGAHHSIEKASDGTYWVPTNEYLTTDDSINGRYSGLGTPLRVDRAVRITGDGTVLDSLDILSILYQNGLAEYIYRTGRHEMTDVTHLNDVNPLPDSLADEYPIFKAGDILLSLRNLSMILVVNPDTKNVRWWDALHFVQQHDPDWIGQGWIGVYDNRRDGTSRGSVLGGSRVVAVQPKSGSVRVLHHGDFHSNIMGEWQRLGEDRYLITESLAGRAFIVDEGETVWNWLAPTYGEDRVPRLAEATKYNLKSSTVRRWSCDGSKSQSG